MMREVEVCGRKIVVKGEVLRIAKLDADKYHYLDNPHEVLEGLRSCSTRVDVFSFLQSLGQATPRFDYPMEWDNLAVLSISSFEDWWKNQIRFEARNRAKQAAKKGLIVKEVPFSEELVYGMWQIYNECKNRQGRPFPHYGKSLEVVFREAATYLEWSTFIGVFFEEKIVGFAKLVADERRLQANLMSILSMIAHRSKAPTNAIVAEAVRACAMRGYRYLVYQNFVYGNKGPDSLSKFKEVNGFGRVEVPRYYVPLTALGDAALKCGFHRRLAERLPPGVAAKMRDLRDAWYDWRHRDPKPAQPST